MVFNKLSILISIIMCSHVIHFVLSMKPLQSRAMTKRLVSDSSVASSSLVHGGSGLGCSCSYCINNFKLLPKKNEAISQSALFQAKTASYTRVGSSDDEDEDFKHIENLLQNNREWVKDMKAHRPEEYRKLGANQTPKYLYFGCSDSRVPDQVYGLGPGDVFVHRNVGNLVPGNDLNVLSVLEFAVDHLGITDILVTGHYNCGAVKAAVARKDLGFLENWLRSIRDVYRLHRDYLDRIVDDDERHKMLVELNVVENCVNLFKTGIVQRKRLQNSNTEDYELKNAPRIHGLVFDTSEGYLYRLNIDYSRFGSLDNIYALY